MEKATHTEVVTSGVGVTRGILNTREVTLPPVPSTSVCCRASRVEGCSLLAEPQLTDLVAELMPSARGQRALLHAVSSRSRALQRCKW